MVVLLAALAAANAQLVDRTKAPNPANEGIAKSLADEIGAGRGDTMTPNSSMFLIRRDPFRAIRRGRQIFQRKFQRLDGSGDYTRDGKGDIASSNGIGAGMTDSCAACHGRPRGAAGFGGDVATRPDSRDAPHLFGLGLKEMLADEITAELRGIRSQTIAAARSSGASVTSALASKGIHYGSVTAGPDGSVDTSQIEGIDPDLRVRPFFHHGGTVSIREFVIGAMNAEMGFQCWDPEVTAAATQGASISTPAGMVLNGKLDKVEAPPDPDPAEVPPGELPRNQVATAVVDYLEFYLLNYFKPALYEQTERTANGRAAFERIGCASCHVPDLQIDRDRRVADVETVFDPDKGNFNRLFATPIALFDVADDGAGFPPLRLPKMQSFLVRNIFTDFKRHDLGPNFWERNYDGTLQKQMMTTALWGVGTTAPYGHDGRSVSLTEVILRHGGEGQQARNAFAALSTDQRSELLEFLQSLVLFPPDDTASTLDPGDRAAPDFPQVRHGSIKLTVLFNDPSDIE